MLIRRGLVIDLVIVFLVWPIANLSSWLKWQVYHEIIVPMWCKLAIFADGAAFRLALWLIIAVELYMAVQYSFQGKIVANAVF